MTEPRTPASLSQMLERLQKMIGRLHFWYATDGYEQIDLDADKAALQHALALLSAETREQALQKAYEAGKCHLGLATAKMLRISPLESIRQERELMAEARTLLGLPETGEP